MPKWFLIIASKDHNNRLKVFDKTIIHLFIDKTKKCAHTTPIFYLEHKMSMDLAQREVLRLVHRDQMYRVIGYPDAKRVIFRRHATRAEGGIDDLTLEGEIEAFRAGMQSNFPIHLLVSTSRVRTIKSRDRFAFGYSYTRFDKPCIRVIEQLGNKADEWALVTPKVVEYQKDMSQIDAFLKAHGEERCRYLANRFLQPLREKVFNALEPGQLAMVFSHEPLIVLSVWALLDHLDFSSYMWRNGTLSPTLFPLEGYELIQYPDEGERPIDVVSPKVEAPFIQDEHHTEFIRVLLERKSQKNWEDG